MDEKIKRLNSWFKGKSAPPIKFDIFVTNKCNLRCVFCGFPDIPASEHQKELSDEQLVSLVKEAGNLGAKIFGILGGEPFVRKDITIQLMKLGKEAGMEGSLVTNGVMLNENDIKEIIKSRWDLIRFSIDGSKAEIHDYLRGKKGSFNKTVENLKLFQKLKKEMNLQTPTLEINTVLCKKNISDLPAIIEMAKDLKIKRVYILPMIDFGKGTEHLRIKEEDTPRVLEAIKKAKKLIERYNLDNNYNVDNNLNEIEKDYLFVKPNKMDKVMLDDKKKQEKGYIPCFLPWYGICVSAHGEVTPCAAVTNEKSLFCGNVKKESLNKIWQGKKFSKIRDNMVKKMLPEGCSRCCMPLVDENQMLRTELQKQKDNGKD